MSAPQAALHERLNHFNGLIIGHPHLTSVLEDITTLIGNTDSPLIIGVIGAAGVGKSTLLSVLKDRLWKRFAPAGSAGKGSISVINIAATVQEHGRYPWGSYYWDTLQALQELLIDRKQLDPAAPQVYSPGKPTPATVARRWALEQSLRYRKTRAVLIDDAHYITASDTEGSLRDHAQNITNMTVSTGTTHLLVGNHTLLPLLQAFQELKQPVRSFHLLPYSWKESDDRVEFAQLIHTFQHYLPITPQPDLDSRIEYLYQGCCGSIGILKVWLQEAIQTAVQAGLETLTSSHLDTTVLESQKRLVIAREMNTGLQHYSKFTGQQGRPMPKKKATPPRPGVRKPQRDHVKKEGSTK